jgi:hypothetical protein
MPRAKGPGMSPAFELITSALLGAPAGNSWHPDDKTPIRTFTCVNTRRRTCGRLTRTDAYLINERRRRALLLMR